MSLCLTVITAFIAY